MSYMPHILRDDSLSIFVEGRPKVIDSTHPNFSAAVEAVRERRWDDIVALIDVPAAIVKFSEGRVQVCEGEVRYNGLPVHNVVANRIIKMMGEGFDFTPMVRFLDKVMQNPIPSARDELFLWLEQSDMPIVSNGDFLAYKWVREDYTDCHSGTFDNSVGMVVSMPREDVDPDRSRTCSRGLHFCSLSYLPHFAYGQGRCMILQINPADVVAIPHDYSNAKGRTWRYHVIAEYAEKNILQPAFERAVFDPEQLRKEAGIETVYGRRFNVHLRGLDGEGAIHETSIEVQADDATEAQDLFHLDEYDNFVDRCDGNEPKVFKVEEIEMPKWAVEIIGRMYDSWEDRTEYERVTIHVFGKDQDEVRELVVHMIDNDDFDPFMEISIDDYDIGEITPVVDEPEAEPAEDVTVAYEEPAPVYRTWWRRLIGG